MFHVLHVSKEDEPTIRVVFGCPGPAEMVSDWLVQCGFTVELVVNEEAPDRDDAEKEAALRLMQLVIQPSEGAA